MTISEAFDFMLDTIIQNESGLKRLNIKGRCPNPYTIRDADFLLVEGVTVEDKTFDLSIVYSDVGDNYSCVVFERCDSYELNQTLIWNLKSIPPSDEDWFTLLHELGHIFTKQNGLDPVLEEYLAWEWALKHVPFDLYFPIDKFVEDIYSYHVKYGWPIMKQDIRTKLLRFLT